jgi:hypothetical protein
LICLRVGFSFPDRMPEAIEDTLLEVCFGLLFFAAGAAALLFAAGLEPAGLAAADFAAPVLAAAPAPVRLAALPLEPPFGAALFPADTPAFDAAGFAPVLFVVRDRAPPPPFLTAIVSLLRSSSAARAWQTRSNRYVCQARG